MSIPAESMKSGVLSDCSVRLEYYDFFIGWAKLHWERNS